MKIRKNLNMLQWQSIRTRMTFFSLVIFVMSIWSLSFYASRMLYMEMERHLGDQQFSTASIVASMVNQELEDRLKALEIAANRLGTDILSGTMTPQGYLEDRTLTLSLFNAGTFITRIDGTVMADVPLSSGRTGVNFMDNDYLIGPLKDGKSTIGRPVLDTKLHAPAFTMAVPLRDTRGKVIGALAGVTRLDIPNFLDRIAGNRYGKSGYYLLEDPKNRLIITGTGKSRVMQPLPPPGVNALIDRHVQGYDETGITVNPLGVEVLASARRIPVADWFLVVALPTAEAFAPIHNMRQGILQATIFLTLLAGGLTLWMLRHHLSPLLVAARKLADLSDANQPPQPLPITSQDEIGSLIGGFNRLLETSNQREVLLKQILDTSSVAIFLVDMEGRIKLANQRMAEMFGSSLDTLTEKEYDSLVHPGERETAREKMLALLNSAVDSVDLERLYWRTDNTEFWGHLTGRCFYDTSNEKQGLVGVIADITERKKTEVELHKKNAEIEQFIYTVSHDLRSPLVTVKTFMGFLEKDMAEGNQEQLAQDIGFIHGAADKMKLLLDELLEMSRIGRAETPPVSVSFKEMLGEVLDALAGAISERKVDIHLLDTELMLFGDRPRLYQIWQNLIENAIKYSRGDSIPRIELGMQQENGETVFFVKDNGIGIESQYHSRIFGIFDKLDPKSPGAGLGLSMVQRIVEKCGGRIWVESEGISQGSCFFFTLPQVVVQN